MIASISRLDNFSHFKQLSSTQTTAKQFQNGDEWTLVWADEQRQGKGRKNRDWKSRPGGLYYSLRYPPGTICFEPPFQILIASHTWLSLLEESFPELGDLSIKWPNDLLCSGRKIAGFLAEAVRDSVILGGGINVNNALDMIEDQLDQPATSLIQERGEPTSRRDLLMDWLGRFQSRVLGKGEVSVSEIEERVGTIGRRIRSHGVEGEATSITEEGGLVVESGNQQQIVHASDHVEVPTQT